MTWQRRRITGRHLAHRIWGVTNGLHHPLHIVVHHEALVAWWERLNDSVNDRLVREVNVQLGQAAVQPRHFEYVLTDRSVFLHLTTVELVGDFISLDPGMSLENLFSSSNISYASCYSKRFWSPGSKL